MLLGGDAEQCGSLAIGPLIRHRAPRINSPHPPHATFRMWVQVATGVRMAVKSRESFAKKTKGGVVS